MPSSPCLICGSDASVSVLEAVPGYDILYCGSCRLRFSNPMSHPGQAFYEESHLYDNRDMGRVSLSLPRLEWRYRAFFRRARPRPGQRLLDLGCGDGGLLSMAAGRGLDAFGLELDTRGVAIAKQIRGLKQVEQGRFEKAVELGWKDFDCVTCMEVLEHVPDPEGLARFIRGLLRPGGVAAISVPSWDRRPAWFDRKTDYPPHHFTLWTREALAKLLTKAGFEVVEVLEAPVSLQTFLYAILSGLKAKRSAGTGTPAAPKKTAPGETAGPVSARAAVKPDAPAMEGPAPSIRLDRMRIAIKACLYLAFNLVNPLLRIAPGLRGPTLLAIAKRPAAG